MVGRWTFLFGANGLFHGWTLSFRECTQSSIFHLLLWTQHLQELCLSSSLGIREGMNKKSATSDALWSFWLIELKLPGRTTTSWGFYVRFCYLPTLNGLLLGWFHWWFVYMFQKNRGKMPMILPWYSWHLARASPRAAVCHRWQSPKAPVFRVSEVKIWIWVFWR